MAFIYFLKETTLDFFLLKSKLSVQCCEILIIEVMSGNKGIDTLLFTCQTCNAVHRTGSKLKRHVEIAGHSTRLIFSFFAFVKQLLEVSF